MWVGQMQAQTDAGRIASDNSQSKTQYLPVNKQADTPFTLGRTKMWVGRGTVCMMKKMR